MELYGTFTSPFVRHCRIALVEVGLPGELVPTDAAASALASPTKKVPFLVDGGLRLTDSSAILRHLRERSGRVFLPELADHDLYCLASTALDAAINLFYLEKEGLTSASSAYLGRQAARVRSSLDELEQRPLADALRAAPELPLTDGELRVACFLDWALFRRRLELADHPRLRSFLALAHGYGPFAATAPHD
jgi:glutathione S-transferase